MKFISSAYSLFLGAMMWGVVGTLMTVALARLNTGAAVFTAIVSGAFTAISFLLGVLKTTEPKRRAKKFARIFSALPNPPKAADKERWRRDVQVYVRTVMARRALLVRADCDRQESVQKEAKDKILAQLGGQAAQQLDREHRAELRERTKLVENSKKRFEEARELALFFGYQVEKHWTNYLEKEPVA